MTLIEHLYELRTRLAISFAAIAITSIVGYVWFGVGFFGWPSLGEILKGPYCSLPPSARPAPTAEGGCTLFALAAFDQFSLRMLAESSSSRGPLTPDSLPAGSDGHCRGW